MSRLILSLLLLPLLCTCGRAPEAAQATPATALAPEISFSKHRVVFSPETGGRMASYTFGGKELLKTSRDENGWQWGSTVWTSPQSAWNWPPESTFDAAPFTVTQQTGSSIILQSAVDEETGLQMTKSFAFIKGAKGSYLEADYRLFNRGQDTIYRGLWENTRLPYGGEYSFLVDSLRQDNLDRSFTKRRDHTVVNLSPEDTEKGKLFVYPAKGRCTFVSNGLHFRKLWFLDGTVAPKQSPLEIYLDPEAGFTEFEVQGPYQAIAPGESVKLVVGWKVTTLTEKE